MIATAKKAVSGTLRMARFTTTVVGLAIMLALVVGVASTALGANGGNLILGQTNVASALTQAHRQRAGSTVEVQNNDPGTDDTALSLKVQPGEAPMRVALRRQGGQPECRQARRQGRRPAHPRRLLQRCEPAAARDRRYGGSIDADHRPCLGT